MNLTIIFILLGIVILLLDISLIFNCKKNFWTFSVIAYMLAMMQWTMLFHAGNKHLILTTVVGMIYFICRVIFTQSLIKQRNE